MPDDASLDDFLDAGEDQQDESSEEGDDAPNRELVDSATVEDATTTFEWSPARAACEGCGEVVERRWRDDGSFVCPSCKTW